MEGPSLLCIAAKTFRSSKVYNAIETIKGKITKIEIKA